MRTFINDIVVLFRRAREHTNPRFFVKFDKLECIFISAPKNANSTINSMLFAKEGYPFDPNDYSSIHKEKRKHLVTPRETLNLRDEYYVFSFTRNPFSRLVSCYKNKIQEEDHPIGKGYFGRIHQSMSFTRFAEVVCSIPDIVSDPHFQSQYSFLFFKGKPLCHYLGKVEQFEQDIQPIIVKYQLEPGPNQNVSTNTTPWRDFYTPELARKVYKRYKKDFTTFGYSDEYEKLLHYLSRERS